MIERVPIHANCEQPTIACFELVADRASVRARAHVRTVRFSTGISCPPFPSLAGQISRSAEATGEAVGTTGEALFEACNSNNINVKYIIIMIIQIIITTLKILLINIYCMSSSSLLPRAAREDESDSPAQQRQASLAILATIIITIVNYYFAGPEMGNRERGSKQCCFCFRAPSAKT